LECTRRRVELIGTHLCSTDAPDSTLVQITTLTTFTVATNEYRGGGNLERTEYHPLRGLGLTSIWSY